MSLETRVWFVALSPLSPRIASADEIEKVSPHPARPSGHAMQASAPQHPHAAILAGKLQRHDGADAFLALESDLSAVLAHDALHDHQAEAVAAGFRRVVGLKHPHEILLLDA